MHSFQEGSSHHYYQAVPDDMPAEYWVRLPPESSPLLRKKDHWCWLVHPALRVCNHCRSWEVDCPVMFVLMLLPASALPEYDVTYAQHSD